MPGVPLILLGNKVDLEDKREVTSPFVSIPLNSSESVPEGNFYLVAKSRILVLFEETILHFGGLAMKKMWSKMTLRSYSFILSCTPPFENNNFTTSNPPTWPSPTTLIAHNMNSQNPSPECWSRWCRCHGRGGSFLRANIPWLSWRPALALELMSHRFQLL